MNKGFLILVVRTVGLGAMAIIAVLSGRIEKVRACQTCDWTFVGGTATSASCQSGNYAFCSASGTECNVGGEGGC